MSNKRIQKKRDKQKLILRILKFSYTEEPESLYELRKTTRIMRNMTMPALIRLGQDILKEWVMRNTPLRRMIPRSPYEGEMVQWKPIVSLFSEVK